MIHPDTCLRLVDASTGYGVFATAEIPRGTVVWIHDALDQVIPRDRLGTLPPVLRAAAQRYGYVDAAGDLVLCWDHGRYMNHSCDPSTTSIGTYMEIARRDLAPGDELTCEYGLDHVVEAFECRCGAPHCRGRLLATDGPEVARRWDEEAATAFAWALHVPQPVLAAARASGPEHALVQAIVERRAISLPSWTEGVPGSRSLA